MLPDLYTGQLYNCTDHPTTETRDVFLLFHCQHIFLERGDSFTFYYILLTPIEPLNPQMSRGKQIYCNLQGLKHGAAPSNFAALGIGPQVSKWYIQSWRQAYGNSMHIG